MKIGSSKKSMPQLIWFVLYEKVDIVKKRLEKGADVNLCPELDESAIGVAVETCMSITVPYLRTIEMFGLPA